LARRGADLYLEMIFVNGMYHADPHPGNILVLPSNVIGLLDFGMVGRLDEKLRESIEEMLLAISNRDAEYLTSIIIRLGAVPPDLDYAALSLDVADFVSHYATKSLSEINLSAALNEMTEMIRRYHIMLPARVGMLIKVLVMLEGTSKLLWPNFSLMEVMQPYRRKMLRRRLSPVRRLKKMRRIFGELEYLAEIVPRRLGDILHQVQTGKFDVHLDHRGLEPSVNRLVLGMLSSALFLGSSLLLSHNTPPLLRDISVPGITGITLSLALGLRLLRAITKSGHLDRRQ
jgi:ubiquinone biosynthesis protein